MFSFLSAKSRMPSAGEALPGRVDPLPTALNHFVNGQALKGPYPEGFAKAMFGMGCFWGAERMFWEMQGVWVTASGYAGGFTRNPTYKEVCTGMTGHNEVVLVVYDPSMLSYDGLLKAFWENHDPTQGMRQGNDVGTQYRSGIYAFDDEQRAKALQSKDAYSRSLKEIGLGRVTTEVAEAPEFYFAEDYHQQYLAKVPGGYCNLRGTGVQCPAIQD